MAAVIIEQESGQNFQIGGDDEYAEKIYKLFGDYTETTIYAAVAAVAPTTFTSPATSRTLYRQRFSMNVGEGAVWVVTVPYGPNKPKDTSDPPEFSFDIATDSVKITQSISTPNRYPSGTAPDLKGAIGWNGNEVEGVDVLTPKCSLRYKVIVADGTMTDAFKRSLSKLVGKTNNATYKGYTTDELLLTSISGAWRFDTQDWEVTFTLAVSEGVTGLSIGTITGIAKPGWHYLWVKYKQVLSGTSKIPEPEFVYIEQVYPQANFSTLPI